jgi:DNA-binding response OmpR family regulator
MTMKILFAYGHLISKDYAGGFLQRTGYEIDAVNYRGLLTHDNLADYLAPYETIIVETYPIRATTHNPNSHRAQLAASFLHKLNYDETEVFGLLQRMRAASNVPILAIANGLTTEERQGLNMPGVKIIQMDFGLENKIGKKTLWRGISNALTENPLQREIAVGGAEPASQDEFDASSELMFDGKARIIQSGGRPIELTHGECQYLQLFWNRAGGTISRITIYNSLWAGSGVEKKIIDVRACMLRKKLAPLFPGKDPDNFPLATVWGVGYTWAGPLPRITHPYIPKEAVERRERPLAK